MRILTTQKGLSGLSGLIGSEGKLWWYYPNLETFDPTIDLHEIRLPNGTISVQRRPCWLRYNYQRHSRLYGVAAWTSNILLDEHYRALRQSIPAPTLVPTVTAVAGPGVTVSSICRLRFLDMLGNRVGPMSAAAPTLNLSNQQRQWSSLPTTCLDPSVSHLQGLVSDDGAGERVAWTRQLGVTTVTEAVATALLEEAAPPDFEPMPLGTMNALYHDVQLVGGNELYPERVFISAVGELENYEGLFVQSDGEPVNGIFCANDQFFYGTHERIYRGQGFTAVDLTREVEKPDIGIINHDGICALHRRTIVPSTIGFYLYDGSWHYLMDDRQSEWAREYKLRRVEYETAQGYFNPRRNAYIFGPVTHSHIPGFVDWVLDAKRLLPELEASEFSINWANDTKARRDTTRATYFLPGSGQPFYVSGDTGGNLWKENPGVNEDDGLQKMFVVQPATLAPDMGGALLDANIFHKLWVYYESLQPFEVQIFTGDDRVGDQDNTAAVPNLVQAIDDPGPFADMRPETVWPFILEMCSGRALSAKLVQLDPNEQNRYRGYGGTYTRGPAMTGLQDSTTPE